MLGEICKKCKLYQGCKTPFMSGSGSSNPDILFVGEAPGAQEDELGEPFVGRSGELLRDIIDMFELSSERYRFTNTVRCRPPENKTPTTTQLRYCSEFLVEEIEKTNPSVIMLLGNSPLKSVLGVSGITNYNGQVIHRDDFTYVPAFHPAYVLRNNTEPVLESWISAFEVAVNAADGHIYKSPVDSYTQYYPEYVDELLDMQEEINKATRRGDLTAYDIESHSLSLFNNNILTLAFATSDKCWSFPLDHKESFWTESERIEVVRIISEILTTANILTHTKFDLKITRATLGIDFGPQAGDTIHLAMLANAHHFEFGLKRLAGMYLRMFDYDKELSDYTSEHAGANPGKGGTYDNVPLDILLPYGNLDVIATRKLADVLYDQLTEKQKHIYHQLILPADYELGLLEQNGIAVDWGIAKRYRHLYRVVKKRYKQELIADDRVNKFIRDKQEEMDADWRERSAKSSRTLKRYKFKFNPNSSQQMGEVFYSKEYCGFPIYEKTATGNPSIKKSVLEELKYDFREHNLKEEAEFIQLYMNWKLLSTALSKTIKPILSKSGDWYSPDRRVRSRYTIGGAKTGRLSSASPNLQNIPSVEKNPGTLLQHLPIKNVFTHTWKNGCLLMADYSGMELRVVASVAGITDMIKVFSRGGDVHRYVSSLIYKKPEEEITKFERYRGKWCNWSLLYLGSWHTLYGLYRVNGLTENEAKKIANLYFDAFPELVDYQNRTVDFIKRNKYVESPFGRILRLSEVDDNRPAIANKALRTGVNMPIQGTASDTLQCAIIVIGNLMRKERMRSMLVNTVHDSLVTDIYPGELNDVQSLQKEVLENITSYAPDYFPDLDFSWLRVPLVADFDIGSHYGSYGSLSTPRCECGELVTESRGYKIVDDEHVMFVTCGKCPSFPVSVEDNIYYFNKFYHKPIQVSQTVPKIRKPRLIL